MRVMGLDISTSTIGIAVIETEPLKLLFSGYHKPDKSLSELRRLVTSRDEILNKIIAYSVNEVAVEEYLQYMAGKSGAGTILPLAIMNRTVCVGIFDRFQKEPKMYNVNTVRSVLKINNITPKKENMPDVVAHHLGVDFPYSIHKYKNGKEKILKESYDVADAIAVALAHVRKLKDE